MAGKMTSDTELIALARAIAAGNSALALQTLKAQPELAHARLTATGATRQKAKDYFLDEIGHYIYAGDSALHIAAAAYNERSSAS